MTTSPTGNRKARARASDGGTGFSLVEVLVSVAILAVGVASALCAFRFCLSSLGASGDALRANALLKEKVDEIALARTPGPARGGSEGGDQGLEWTAEAAPVPGSGGAGLTEVKVTVAGRNGGAAYSASAYLRARE